MGYEGWDLVHAKKFSLLHLGYGVEGIRVRWEKIRKWPMGCSRDHWPCFNCENFPLGPAVLPVQQGEAPPSGDGEDSRPAVHRHGVPAPVLCG